jgi:Na+/H+ antiporter NhaD/arsenite permease-like protein
VADPSQAEALWWALAVGADFGRNLTAIGASANVVVLGIAMRAGSPISFWTFTKKSAGVTVVTIARAAYLWLRYFVVPQ